MLKFISTRLQERVDGLEGEGVAESGFTLIELMVVLLIIAILLAIAIPTFLGVTGSANDRAAQSNLTNALTEAKAQFQNAQSYATASLPTAALTASAPEFSWVQSAACTAEGTTCVSEYPVDVAAAVDGQGVILATYAKTGTCWYVADLEVAPSATAFTDTNGTKQFQDAASATTGSGTQWVTQGVSPAAGPGAGVFYAKSTPAGSAGCNATLPTANATGSTTWYWGTSYSNAPNL